MSKLLVDTDAFCKLGVAGLLREAAEVFGATLAGCARLPALPYMLRRGALRKRYGAIASDALIPLAESLPVIDQPSTTWLEKLAPVNAIDPGEAQIFAVAAASGLTLLSGDKRALSALKDVEGFPGALEGRIAVLEAVLLALCDQLGHEKVRESLAPLIAADTVVRICFSEGNPDPAAGLLSYYTSLADDVEPLVLWHPRGQKGI